MIPFSIVIPVRNEEKHIRRCLNSLVCLNYDPESYEVIVIDNGSTDRTRAIVSSFEAPFQLRLMERPDVYISALRNAGAALALGKYLVFLDADCEVPTNWLEQASHLIADRIDEVFGSHYNIPERSSWIAQNWYEGWEQRSDGEVSFLPSGDLFIRRDIFEDLQGFNEKIQTNEDYELCQRIRSRGFRILCDRRLAVVHWGTPQTLSAFFRKHRWHGTHVFRVFWTGLPALKNVKPVAFAVYTLLGCGTLVVATLACLAGARLWILFGSLLFLIAPSIILGTRAAIRAGKVRRALPISILVFTYGAARAACLWSWSNFGLKKARLQSGPSLESRS